MSVVSIPASYARALLDLVNTMNVKDDAMLVNTSLSRMDLEYPGMRIELATYAMLLQRAHKLTMDEALPLRLGTWTKITSHGYLGLAALSATTLGDAFEVLERFTSARLASLSIEVSYQADEARVTLAERMGLGELREPILVAVMSHLTSIITALTGRTVSAIVELSIPAPAYFTRHTDLVHGTWIFSRPTNRILLPRAAFAWPLLLADVTTTRLAREQCELELEAVTGDPRITRVRTLIARPGGGYRSLDEISREMQISSRTLKRALAASGTSYSHMLEQRRRARAMQLLQNRSLGVESIARALGYSDRTTFTRAFRRWTGTSPGAFRR